MKFFKTLLKWIVILCVALLITGMFAIIFDWPLWVSIIVFVFVLFFILLAIHLVRKKIYEYKTGFITKETEEDLSELSCLFRYKQFVEMLEVQHHKHLANNLKSLPWAINFTVGEPIFFNSMQHFSIATTQCPDDNEEMDVGAKWAATENFVVVTPERSVYENFIKNDSWIRFLEEVCKWRPDGPFNKIIINISLKDLLTDIASITRDKLGVIQQKIKQIYSVTGFNIPVAIVFTDLQNVENSDEFLALLTTADLQQAIGSYAENSKSNGAVHLFSQCVDQLNNYIDERSLQSSPEKLSLIYRFLANLETLSSNVDQICSQVVPPIKGKKSLLSGLFFMGTQTKAQEANTLIFAHDLIQLMLPKQNLEPFQSAQGMERSRFREKYKLAILYAIYAIVLVYLLYAFLGTNQSLRAQLKSIPPHLKYSTEFRQNLISISQYHDLMQTIIEYQGRWTIRVLPFHAGLHKIEKIYISKFHKEFSQYIYPFLDVKVHAILDKDNGQLTPIQRGDLIESSVESLNVIQAKLDGRSYDYYESLNSPTLSYLGTSQISPEILQSYGKLFKFYIWTTTDKQELLKQKSYILRLLTTYQIFTGDPDLDWLVQWANAQPMIKPILLNQFWHGSANNTTTKIDGAYTPEGARLIHKLIDEINLALPGQNNLGYEEGRFKLWYTHQRLNAWYQFGLNFSRGTETLKYRADWGRFFDSSVMLSTKGPYYEFLDLINHEFSDITLENPPEWLTQIRKFYSLLDFVVKKDDLVKGKHLTAVTRKFFENLKKTPSALIRQNTLKETYERSYDSELQAAEAFLNYQVGLDTLYGKDQASIGTAFTTAKALYATGDENSSPQAKTVYAAYAEFLRMRQLIGGKDSGDTLFWSLIRGPLDYYVDYTSRQASCFVQQEWQSDVLKSISGLTGSELSNTLFGQKGVVWSFASKYLQPFLQINNNLFVPKIVLGHTFPFNNEFYNFINYGLVTQTVHRELKQFEQYFNESGGHDLTITSTPATVNSSAEALPYKVSLTTACNNKAFFINNYNFRVSTGLKWTLGQCGPAKVTIYFNTFTLIKNYPGQFGFAHFLTDFSQGPTTYTPADFPTEQHAMSVNKVSSVQVNFKIAGMEDVSLKLANFFKLNAILLANEHKYINYGQVPSTIGLCWDHTLETKIDKVENSQISNIIYGGTDGKP